MIFDTFSAIKNFVMFFYFLSFSLQKKRAKIYMGNSPAFHHTIHYTSPPKSPYTLSLFSKIEEVDIYLNKQIGLS